MSEGGAAVVIGLIVVVLVTGIVMIMYGLDDD